MNTNSVVHFSVSTQYDSILFKLLDCDCYHYFVKEKNKRSHNYQDICDDCVDTNYRIHFYGIPQTKNGNSDKKNQH